MSGTARSDRTLFRKEAVDFQHNYRQWGDVASLQPLSTKLVSWFLVASAAAIVCFVSIAQYSRKETALGYLTPTTGTAKIFAPQRGTIKLVHVEESQVVHEGDPLLTIETNQITADGIDVNASMLETLVAQKALLAKNMSAEEQRASSEQERLASLIRGLAAETSQLRDQIQIQTERLKVAQSDLAAAEHLRSKGFTTELEFKRRQVKMLEDKQAVGALNQQLTSRESQLRETTFALEQLPTLMAQKVQALRNELASTQQRIAEVNGRRAYVLRAPTTGRISTMQATVGQSADPQRLQLEIIPEEAVLEAQLFVPARAIGFVQLDQPVRILYDAFPYQHFGTYSGHVVKISQTILTTADAAGPIPLKEPAYRVTAALERADVDAYGKKLMLQPDMLLKADIILEKRSLLNWLISPITSVRM
jgi:membrane fusion protein